MKHMGIGFFSMSMVVLTALRAEAQCVSNDDCKGARVCQSGACVDPGPAQLPAATPPPVQATDPCAGITCSGLGSCELQNGQPVCICNAGYTVDASGRNCVPTVGATPTAQPAQPAQPPAAPAQPAQPTAQRATPVAEPAPAAQDPPPALTGEVTPENRKRKRFMALGHASFWTGVAAAGLGAAATAIAINEAERYKLDFDKTNKESAQNWTGVMWAGFGAGLVLMTTGIGFWVVAPDKTSDAQGSKLAVVPVIARGDFGLTITGRW